MPQENGNVTNNVTPGGQNNPQNTLVQQGTTQPVNVDYDRMAEAIEKRSNSFMKTYLKEQGLSETEMQEAIKTFKDNKAKSSLFWEKLSDHYGDAYRFLFSLSCTQCGLQSGSLDPEMEPGVLFCQCGRYDPDSGSGLY